MADYGEACPVAVGTARSGGRLPALRKSSCFIARPLSAGRSFEAVDLLDIRQVFLRKHRQREHEGRQRPAR
jgi:hypothetical protein